MEKFGFNKVDEDDMFNPKQSRENMKSLSDIEMIGNNSKETTLSDVDITSYTPNVDSMDEVVDDVSSSITTSLSSASSYIEDAKIDPLPDSPLFENMDTNESLTVETSKNLHINKQLEFDLKNQAYTPAPVHRQSPLEGTMASSRASIDNHNFDIPNPLSVNSSANKRANRKGAHPEWRTRLG